MVGEAEGTWEGCVEIANVGNVVDGNVREGEGCIGRAGGNRLESETPASQLHNHTHRSSVLSSARQLYQDILKRKPKSTRCVQSPLGGQNTDQGISVLSCGKRHKLVVAIQCLEEECSR